MRIGVLSDTHLNEIVRALQAAIRSIQRLEDEMQLILSAVESSLDSDSALSRLSSAREELFACYERGLPSFSDWEMEAFHRAKSQSVTIENTVRLCLAQQPYASCISDSDRTRPIELRNRLTDAQHLLRDSLTDRVARRFTSER